MNGLESVELGCVEIWKVPYVHLFKTETALESNSIQLFHTFLVISFFFWSFNYFTTIILFLKEKIKEEKNYYNLQLLLVG